MFPRLKSMPAYFDHNATTRIDDAVLEAMLPYLRSEYGNASSRHAPGERARAAIDTARRQVAESVGVQSSQVIFTGSGSEANNLFLKGVASRLKPGILRVSSIEHPSVMKSALSLAQQGWTLQKIPLNASGVLEFDQDGFEGRAQLVSVMLANNETGAILDVHSVAQRSAGAWVHCDAVQAYGKIPVNFRELGVNALTLSAHKINGPKGIGALIIDKRLPLYPLVDGGGQERGLRSGTENVAAIVGFGMAAEMAMKNREHGDLQLSALRRILEEGLAAMGATVFAAEAPRIPNTCFFAVPGINGEALLLELDRAGFYVASGAACSKGSSASTTLQAMGVDSQLAACALRVSLGGGNSASQIGEFLLALRQIRERLLHLPSIAA